MLYGCLGVAGATQNAFNRAWAVPGDPRPNPITAACADCCCPSWAPESS
jgi:hypothetical protein